MIARAKKLQYWRNLKTMHVESNQHWVVGDELQEHTRSSLSDLILRWKHASMGYQGMLKIYISRDTRFAIRCNVTTDVTFVSLNLLQLKRKCCSVNPLKWVMVVASYFHEKKANVVGVCCCDRKSRAACAQSFAPWQQATIEISRRGHSIIACSRHIHIFLFFAYIPFVVNRTINATPPERPQHCTNGALAMLGNRSGLINRKNIRSPNAAGAQCAIHRDALADRTWLHLQCYPTSHWLLTIIVNFVKASAVKSRLFAICARRWILTMRLCCSIFCGCPRQNVSSRVWPKGGCSSIPRTW